MQPLVPGLGHGETQVVKGQGTGRQAFVMKQCGHAPWNGEDQVALCDDGWCGHEIGQPQGDVALQATLRETAIELATEISHCSPLGIRETRKTMRGDLADRVRAATDHELKIQDALRGTEDFKEGVKAMAERRIPNWQGR